MAERSEPGLALQLKQMLAKMTMKEITPWLFALCITLAEILVSLVNVRMGMLLHAFLLVALLIQASLCWFRDSRAAGAEAEAGTVMELRGTPGYRFYLALTLAPIIRIISLATPMWNFPTMYWYLITGAPLIVTAFVIIGVARYSPEEVGLRP